MKRNKVFAVASVLICISGCSEKGPDDSATPVEIVSLSAETKSTMIEKSDDFGCGVFQNITNGNPKENLIISPLSCAYAVSMTSLGAVNETYEEIVSSLGLAGMSKQELGSFYRGLTADLYSSDKSASFEYANSIWIDKNLIVKPSFINASAEYYNALAQNVDFKNEHHRGRPPIHFQHLREDKRGDAFHRPEG